MSEKEDDPYKKWLDEQRTLVANEVRQNYEPVDLDLPHPADPAITYKPPVVDGKSQHDFPLDENGLSPYSGKPPVYYNGKLISSQNGNKCDGFVFLAGDALHEPLQVTADHTIIPDRFIGGISETNARRMQNLGLGVPGGTVLSDEEHSRRLHELMDNFPERTDAEIQAHVFRVAYEQHMGIHEEEAMKRNRENGMDRYLPSSQQQDAIMSVISQALGLDDASRSLREQTDGIDQDSTITPPANVRTDRVLERT